LFATLNLTLDVALPLIEAGLNVAVIPPGSPVAESETKEEKPRMDVMETVEELLRPW
jgi:hypothetical protein